MGYIRWSRYSEEEIVFMKLSNIKAGDIIRGIFPGQDVTIVSVQIIGRNVADIRKRHKRWIQFLISKKQLLTIINPML